MFSTFKQRLMLGVYIFLILSIPVGAYLASQYQTIKSSAKETKPQLPTVKTTPLPAGRSTTSPAQDLLSASQTNLPKTVSTPSPQPSTVATSFGPTLSLKATLEARPKDNQATRLFVGIVEGQISVNPKFLLSFSVDLPASGQFSNLSLAGLNPGSTYTAIIKGSAQIATSSAFMMSPTVTNLNDGQPLNLLSGDLNDDNTVNSADYSIAQKALGATAKSSNWNGNADLNKDLVINAFDLAIITKNIGQIGASGAWTSPLPKTATPSGGLVPEAPQSSSSGYWIWIPH